MRLFRVEPEPFTPVDSLTWAKMMAWDLAGNARDEIRRARFTAALGAERAAQLLPPVPAKPTILEDEEWAAILAPAASAGKPPASASLGPPGPWPALDRAFDLLSPLGFGGAEIGSNSWVVAGSRTRSGKPLLANDPHLGLRSPSVWYLARLEAPGLSVAGATLPGVPGVIIGHNARIAWGLTSVEPDVADLYLEETDPKDPSRYRHAGQWVPFEKREERIRVRGGKDEVLVLRSSVHGPVVTDILDGAETLGKPVALRWTGLDPDDATAEAFLGIDRAGQLGRVPRGRGASPGAGAESRLRRRGRPHRLHDDRRDPDPPPRRRPPPDLGLRGRRLERPHPLREAPPRARPGARLHRDRE